VSHGLLRPETGAKYKNPDVASLPRPCRLSTIEKKTSSHDGAGWPSDWNLRRAMYIRKKKPRTTTKKAVAMNARPGRKETMVSPGSGESLRDTHRS
jgi:hypothetical protein